MLARPALVGPFHRQAAVQYARLFSNTKRLLSSTKTSMSSDRAAELTSALSSIRQKVPSHVTLVAVSKLKPASDIQALYDAGHRHFGENYIQELIDKAAHLPRDISWHFIGGLQSNKCKLLASSVPNLYAVETVDSLKKANELAKGHTTHATTPLRIYLQVNTSGESEKSGVAPSEAESLAREIQQNEALTLVGVMTIGSLANSRQHGENADFAKLKEVRDGLEKALHVKLQLSMGMSEDFEDAIAQGSDEVRVGSSIFGARPEKKSRAVESQTAQEQS